MTATCYYSCALVRPGFLARRGFVPRPLAALALAGDGGRHPDSFETHPNTCPWVIQLLAAAESALTAPDCTDLVVAPAGCDAMRRMGDLLAWRLGDRIYRPWVPRTTDEAATRRLAKELEALDDWLESHETRRATSSPATDARPAAGSRPATDAPLAADDRRAADDLTGASGHAGPAATATPDMVVTPPVEPRPGGVFVIAGPLSGADLLLAIENAGVAVSGLDSCTGAHRVAALAAGDGGLSFDDEAREMLNAAVCTRSTVSLRREHLASRIAATRPAALIHARLPFCDPGAYDGVTARSLADELDLPFLDIEVGFPTEVTGPVRVRLEAFLETLTLEDELLNDLFAFDDAPPEDRTGGTLSLGADRPDEVRSGRS